VRAEPVVIEWHVDLSPNMAEREHFCITWKQHWTQRMKVVYLDALL
jgi:hypothetical protein